MDFGLFWEGKGVADVGTILIVRNVRACLMIGSFSSGAVGMLRLVRRSHFIDFPTSFDVGMRVRNFT